MTSSDSLQRSARNVLVVDDEPTICWAFKKMLEGQGHHVITASSAEEGRAKAQENPIDLVLLDVRLPGEDGISALPEISKAANAAPVIVMTAFGELETAVSAIRAGATDYITKPFSIDQAQRVCEKALLASPTLANHQKRKSGAQQSGRLVGKSVAIQTVFKQIALVADSDLAVLITGETGTGKELVAAAIHQHSQRSDRPYLPVAPVTFNPDLVESELFGHVAGAFTGAHQDRPGVFEKAEGGTVMLDEIGDLPASVQVKLLRVLEQGEFCRVGEVVPRRADVRIIAATNCNLEAAVKDGTFRADLFYRLNGLAMHLPPLRERAEDIEPLCEYFLSEFGYSATSALSKELVEDLRTRYWSGNIRELKNAVEHAAVVARGRALQIDDFPSQGQQQLVHDARPNETEPVDLSRAIRHWFKHKIATEGPEASGLHQSFLAEAERSLLKLAIEHSGGNRSQAAKILGIHRGTLREKLRDDSED